MQSLPDNIQFTLLGILHFCDAIYILDHSRLHFVLCHDSIVKYTLVSLWHPLQRFASGFLILSAPQSTSIHMSIAMPVSSAYIYI